MIEKFTLVPIDVSDQDKALRFYTEDLGFEKRQDYQMPGHPRWLTVAAKGQELELILSKGTRVIETPKAERTGTYVLKTNDCKRDYETLKARGVKFIETAPVEAPYGTAIHFNDPDDNHFTLIQPNPEFGKR